MTSDERVRISWRRNTDTRYPYGPVSADAGYLEPLGFPPPWPSRPWIYANVITSKNGVVAWTRAGPHDDPVRVIAGGDFTRTGRRADLQLMRYLRACADAVSVGAQTLRDQPDLIGTAEDIGGALGAALSRFRSRQGWPRVPLQVVYSQSGRLDLDVPMFTTPGLTAIIVTTDGGARLLRGRGSEGKGIRTICAGETQVDSVGLVRAHERLFEEFGVRYLACEGGANVLASLYQAGILDEIFVTSTDVAVEPSAHEGITRIFAFEAPAACLIAEGEVASDSGYAFRRWRFNKR